MTAPHLSVALRRRQGGFALDAAFDAPAGVTAIFGPSGSGKTSIARAVAGLDRPEAGHVRLDGETLFDAGRVDRPVHARGVGFVFQEPRLFPHMTVARNLTYGATRGADPAAVADLMDIAPLLPRRPAGLSGGEAARVALGRALLRNPRLLILDEPLAALDAARREAILPYLERLRAAGTPMLYISHAIEEVARLATTLVLLRDGRVEATGPLARLLSDPDVAVRLGPRQAGAVLEGRTASLGPGLTRVDTPAGPLILPAGAAPPGTVQRVRIRAEDVIVATTQPAGLSAQNVLPAVVEAIRPGQGPGVLLRLRAGRGALLARVTPQAVAALDLREGLAVWAIVKASGIAPVDVGADAGADV